MSEKPPREFILRKPLLIHRPMYPEDAKVSVALQLTITDAENNTTTISINDLKLGDTLVDIHGVQHTGYDPQ